MRGRTRSDVLMEDDSMEGQGADGQCSSGETWSLTLIHDDRGSVMEVHHPVCIRVRTAPPVAYRLGLVLVLV